MSEENNYIALKEFCFNQGIDLFGVADISSLREEIYIDKKVLARMNKAISLGFALSKAILEEIEMFPTRLYFHHYRNVNNFLDQVGLKVTKYIQDRGFLAVSIPASQIIDWEKQKGHLSHKKIGYLAGLGWLGRNNLLVNSKFGSQFRLVSILTDYPLKRDIPLNLDCGDCFDCIEA
ncbi:MAG: hypothetical protein N2Z79_00635, partial [Candidatus Omnitrophica bacterium]|nr:hypothetical protein [Candidatus Omnitrophota bacterium]